jgi:hypothetical protein
VSLQLFNSSTLQPLLAQGFSARSSGFLLIVPLPFGE